MKSFKLEYIWIDGYNGLRSKTKLLTFNDLRAQVTLDDCPEWNFDGSSTGQAPGNDSEVIIRPQALFPDPFRGKPHVLVLCDTYLPSGEPHPSNTRVGAVEIFSKALELEPMFGIEQEFFLSFEGWPVGFPVDRAHRPLPQKNFYCGIGGDHAIGRDCIEEAFENCLQAGLSLTGLNAEVAPSQWEFQVCDIGIKAADQLTILRYLVNRTAEKYDWTLDLRPKPVPGDWNGSGCHTNFSTKPMREDGGAQVILEAIKKLGAKHAEHIAVYGKDNDKRLTGEHETCKISEFRWGVADRGASVRVPRSVEKDGRGYFEDRRPASNMDPYLVTSKIFETTSLT